MRPKKIYYSFTLILSLALLDSCAWMSSKRSMFGDPQESKKDLKEQGPVSREQYNALLKKYENLQNQRQEKNIRPGKKMSIVDELKKGPETPELAQTVDVFSKKEGGMLANNVEVGEDLDRFVNDIDDKHARLLESEIFELRKSEKLMNAGNYNDALAVLRKLQKSKYRQVQVRAQFTIGEVLFIQNEFDLAMQAFEEVISKHAFSGVVLKTLGRLIACTEKLKLKEKQDQYYSMLHDFFEGA